MADVNYRVDCKARKELPEEAESAEGNVKGLGEEDSDPMPPLPSTPRDPKPPPPPYQEETGTPPPQDASTPPQPSLR